MTDVAAPLFKKRANKNSNVRKRPATPPPATSDTESDSTDDEDGVRVKRRKTGGVKTSTAAPQQALNTSKSTAYAADRSSTITANDDATRASNWYTDAALAAKDAPSSTGTASHANPDTPAAADGAYRGTAKYSTFISKSSTPAPTTSSSSTSGSNTAPATTGSAANTGRSFGPAKAAPTNVRAITVTDFAPDVCKDYKQTGFCGFGDSCKFLHAREDYKQGWQLDKEWENAGKKKKQAGGSGGGAGRGEEEDLDAEEKMLRDIPFACIICKEGYKDTVVTKCGHYFCQKCAMRRYMKEKTKTCAACGADTMGSFSVAKKLKGLLEKKRIREQEREKSKAEADADS